MSHERPPTAPKSSSGGSAEIRGDWALTPDQVDAVFRRLRPTLPAGRGRIIVGPGLVRAEEVPPDRAALVRGVLATIAVEAAPQPPRRRDVA